MLASTWEQLHQLAKSDKNTLAKEELYQLLGGARDKALAKQALDLTLSDEAAVTTRPEIITSVGIDHPELAFDFVNAHLDQVNSWLEADSRSQFLPRIAGGSNDKAMIGKLEAFAAAHIPATARGEATKAKAPLPTQSKCARSAYPKSTAGSPPGATRSSYGVAPVVRSSLSSDIRRPTGSDLARF